MIKEIFREDGMTLEGGMFISFIFMVLGFIISRVA